MKNLLQQEDGQALVELAAAMFLFYVAVIGIVQVTLLASGWINVHYLARRAAWHGSYYNHLNDRFGTSAFGPISSQLKRLGANEPLDLPQKISGSRKTGFVYEAHYRVKAIGYFKLVWPKGYKLLSARSMVVAYPFGTKSGHPLMDRNAKQHPRPLSSLLRALVQKLNIDPAKESF